MTTTADLSDPAYREAAAMAQQAAETLLGLPAEHVMGALDMLAMHPDAKVRCRLTSPQKGLPDGQM